MQNRVTAVFDQRNQAEQAVQALRALGVRDEHMSLIAQHNDSAAGASRVADHDDTGSGAMTGLAAGAGVGALFGLGAALIPGVGPFIHGGHVVVFRAGRGGRRRGGGRDCRRHDRSRCGCFGARWLRRTRSQVLWRAHRKRRRFLGRRYRRRGFAGSNSRHAGAVWRTLSASFVKHHLKATFQIKAPAGTCGGFFVFYYLRNLVFF